MTGRSTWFGNKPWLEFSLGEQEWVNGRTFHAVKRKQLWELAFSTQWEHGGPIIERENITVRPIFRAERTEHGSDIYRHDGWAAHIEPNAFWVTPQPFSGPTPLIAAMRCYVASKLGDEVDTPKELT